MATSEAKEIKKQETLVRFSIISYKTRLRVAQSSVPNCTVRKQNCIKSKPWISFLPSYTDHGLGKAFLPGTDWLKFQMFMR